MVMGSIRLFLALKGPSARAVYNEQTVVFGADEIAYSAATKYLRQRQFSSILVSTPEEPATTVINQIILNSIEQHPFSSIRELAPIICIPTIAVYRYLTQSLGFVVKHLRWVPQSLTPTQKTERTTLSIELLRHLWFIEHCGCQFLITLDESWFYLSTDHEQIWLRVEQQPPERPRHTIQDPKMMVTIAWNQLGFHSFDALPKGNILNIEYYGVNVLTELLPPRQQVDRRKLVIHADNARPHTGRKCRAFCEETRARLAVHRTHLISHYPTYFSSDISNIVCTESLLHHVKNYLQQFMKSSGTSRDQPWRTCFDTGWRDSNGFLRTMVITIHKLNPG
jgi:hypothetical protein